jgi:tRNA 2-selenouridine synthase
MAFNPSSLLELRNLDVDEVIDVRSPSEFALDHIPGAVNLPVLDDTERAEVGTVYVRDNRFRARKIGAAYVAQNAARHLQTYLADKPGGYHPMVYCWRGGQRSGSFAAILQQIGWRVELLEGGYQTYRRLVSENLYKTPLPCAVLVLDGNTGCAKTDLLLRLPSHGIQVIDLEGLANHRGSIFGARVGGQPSQRAFESALAAAISQLDPTRPVVVEAESSRIGNVTIPPILWEPMKAARRIAVAAPLTARADYLTRTYVDLTDNPATLLALVQRLSPLHAATVIEDWSNLAQSGAFRELAASLMQAHYDPRYGKKRMQVGRNAPLAFEMPSLNEEALDSGAERLAIVVKAIGC